MTRDRQLTGAELALRRVAVLEGALRAAQRAINSMKVEAETAAQGDEEMMLDACNTISQEGLEADMAIRAALGADGVKGMGQHTNGDHAPLHSGTPSTPLEGEKR